MDVQRFTRELQNLLQQDVEPLTHEQKMAHVKAQVAAFEAQQTLLAYRLVIVPFVPGRRPIDEVLAPGLGSSESIGLLDGSSRDHITLLYRLTHAGQPVAELPAGSRLQATLRLLGADGRPESVVPGWEKREITPQRPSEIEAVAPPLAGPSAAEAWALPVDVNETFGPLRAGGKAGDPFGFGSLFSERFQLDLALDLGGVTVGSDSFEFEIFDEQRFGSLYARIAGALLPRDLANQIAAEKGPADLPVSFHPWFPVLCIGVEKANLYMKAIRGDVAEQKRMLTDPAWLLRVGLFLELLTCLGIFEVVKGEIDLLSPEERALFEGSPRFAEIRQRLDVAAWRKVWDLRGISFLKTPGLDMPVGVQNLLRKRGATLGFLHAHHEDLKHAVHLAGPNLVNAQETWARVFRDAERAVLRMNKEAFPELSYLPEKVRAVVLWHRQGALGPLALPAFLAGPFGDQDGLFPSACRQYRSSMNHVADWAAQRGLMEHTGAESVPASLSLLETYLTGNHGRMRQLQKRDGYVGALEFRDLEAPDERLPTDEVVRLIGRVGLFEVLTQDEIGQLARLARPITLGPHERIIIQGNKGSSLFIVHEGELEVIAREGSSETVLANLGRGAIVGEMSFLTGEKRTATVRAVDGATVVEISAMNLQPLVQARPAIVRELTALMKKRQMPGEQDSFGALLERISSTILTQAGL
jgi:hypothetical protein